jgi:serine/threonine protein kinase
MMDENASLPAGGKDLRLAVGRYRVLHKLGEGGMGVVFAAHDDQLDRTVAIKMLRAGGGQEASPDRLWREARSAASVNHPNICQVYEVGEDGGEIFLAMELLEGESLAARLARGAMPPHEAAQTALELLAALAVLHRRGFVHRDVKPSNVFLTPIGAKLLDFGLARPVVPPAPAALDVTLPGTILGTPTYLAPEQVRGEPVDPRTDLFAAGSVLFEMLTGKAPFERSTLPDVLHAVLHEQPPALGGSPAIMALDRIVHRALRKDPAERYATAEAMADAIRAALQLADSGQVSRAVPMTRLIVLPFRILRPDPETDFLAFSLSDAITMSLSGAGPLIVRSTLTAAKFAGGTPDLRRLAEEADVDVALSGTLLRAGSQVRVTAQLVEVPRGTVLWSHTAQVPLGDVFVLQDDLAHRIVDALELPGLGGERQRLRPDVPASAQAYEFYLRANQLSVQANEWPVARDLYLQAVQMDPNFAPAWARLGRLYRVIGLYTGEDPDRHLTLADQALRRALDLNPDLPLAHNLYTNLEVEIGAAERAMQRLLKRAQQSGADPELFAGLVQACRYCGLLDASIAAWEEARRLDPTIRTSVAHAFLMRSDYERVLETNVEDPPILNAAALQLMGRVEEAADLLHQLRARPLPRVLRAFIDATTEVLEGRRREALGHLDEVMRVWQFRDPCGIFYLARLLAAAGDKPGALAQLKASVEGGFFSPGFLLRDPWLDSLRGDAAFRHICAHAEERHRTAAEAFRKAGGESLLGVSGG